jgi:aspartyl-tRNA synthetase
LDVRDKRGIVQVVINPDNQDFAAFTGSNFGAITEKNATIYDGKISNSRSFGYNYNPVQHKGLCHQPL